MKTRYLTILTTLACLGFSVPAAAHDCTRHTDKTHKHCDTGGGGGDPIVYTAKLIDGAFTIDVGADSFAKGNELRSEEDLDMNRPDDEGDLEDRRQRPRTLLDPDAARRRHAQTPRLPAVAAVRKVSGLDPRGR